MRKVAQYECVKNGPICTRPFTEVTEHRILAIAALDDRPGDKTRHWDDRPINADPVEVDPGQVALHELPAWRQAFVRPRPSGVQRLLL